MSSIREAAAELQPTPLEVRVLPKTLFHLIFMVPFHRRLGLAACARAKIGFFTLRAGVARLDGDVVQRITLGAARHHPHIAQFHRAALRRPVLAALLLPRARPRAR